MKQQPSAIAMTSLSGHSGGTTATITNIVRRKSNPKQPRTSAQSAARSTLGYLSQLWGALTTTQQDAWIAAAPNKIKVKNGVAVPLKGNTYFIEINGPLISEGQSPILTPTAPVALPEVSSLVIEQGHIVTTDPSIYFIFNIIRQWNDTPQGDWTAAFLWTGWILSSRFSFPKATKKIDPQSNSLVSSGWAITWNSDGISPNSPNFMGLKANLVERYVNKTTGQIFTANTYRIKVATYTEQYNPPGYAFGYPTVTVISVLGHIIVTVVYENTGEDLNLTEWIPYVKWSGWQADDWDEQGPLTEILANTAITQTDTNEITIKFGNTAGWGPEPTDGQIALLSLGFKNAQGGEIVAFGPNVIFASM